MKFFMSKEEKAELKKKEQEAAENAKQEAEFQAKYTAKQKKKEVLKLIEEITRKEQDLIKGAAEAKAKGFADIYRNQISFIKVARARKMQAEKFLFQVEAMETMKSIADSSSGLLDAMGAIAGTLGALTIDKGAMLEVQKNFAKTQEQLDRQNLLLDEFTSGMEMSMDSVDVSDIDSPGLKDQDIANDIDLYISSSGNNVDLSAYEKYATN